MYEIGIIDEFEAAHSLTGDFGPAARLHGHTYRVEVRVEARDIDETGAFYDISLLRRDLRAALDELHYRNLNDLDAFNNTNTTAETLARHIFRRIEPPLRAASVASLKVTVWESPSVFAGYGERFD
ncbi:MAG TPA: 6-carboxytetrahydropterin synthase [Blastocatellia bacterium]|nr:6-carboxytetrahydropterin synthase [Blastocatellia bacterium]